MPVPNDLTPEEEAAFAQHGVPSPGEGREPLVEGGQQQEPAGGETTPQGQQQEGGDQGQQHIDRRPNGQFASREEREAAAQQQGQQGQQQGQQQEGGDQGQQQEPKFVPLEALHAERARVRQMVQQMQTLQTRTNMLLQQRQPQEQAPQMPDMGEDPAGYILALEQRLARFEQGWQQDRETQQLDTSLNNDEALFAVQQPDYHEASNYYVQSRARELLQFQPPEQVQQTLLREAREIARQSWARGVSAAETIYNMSMARGYNPAQPQQTQQQQTQQQQGQQQGQPNAQQIVEQVRQGQQQSRSLSGGAGGARAAELNAQALLSMSDEEFEAQLGLGSKGANARFAAIG